MVFVLSSPFSSNSRRAHVRPSLLYARALAEPMGSIRKDPMAVVFHSSNQTLQQTFSWVIRPGDRAKPNAPERSARPKTRPWRTSQDTCHHQRHWSARKFTRTLRGNNLLAAFCKFQERASNFLFENTRGLTSPVIHGITKHRLPYIRNANIAI